MCATTRARVCVCARAHVRACIVACVFASVCMCVHACTCMHLYEGEQLPACAHAEVLHLLSLQDEDERSAPHRRVAVRNSAGMVCSNTTMLHGLVRIGAFPTDCVRIGAFPTDCVRIGAFPTDCVRIGAFPTDCASTPRTTTLADDTTRRLTSERHSPCLLIARVAHSTAKRTSRCAVRAQQTHHYAPSAVQRERGQEVCDSAGIRARR